jgi:hypothetical protein
MKPLKRLFIAILKRSSTSHLLNLASILGSSESEITHLKSLPDEEREARFLELVQNRHGGAVDWRGTAEDIYETLQHCITAEESAYLPPVNTVPNSQPAEIIRYLDERFLAGNRAIRSIESLGDFSILLLVPRKQLHEFEKAAGPWII